MDLSLKDAIVKASMYLDPKPLPHALQPDLVDAPAHYTRLNPQPIEVIEAWGLDFSIGSAIKYLARAGFKPGADSITDLRKAVSFINRRIERLANLQGVGLPKGYGPPKDSDT